MPAFFSPSFFFKQTATKDDLIGATEILLGQSEWSEVPTICNPHVKC